MIRKRTLLSITDVTDQICCTLDQTGCSCNCPTCDPGTDCVDCANLTTDDIKLYIGLEGNTNPSGQQVWNLLYPCSSFDTATNIACFQLDSQLIAMQFGRYIAQVQVSGIYVNPKMNLQVGVPFSMCKPYTIPAQNLFNDMQP